MPCQLRQRQGRSIGRGWHLPAANLASSLSSLKEKGFHLFGDLSFARVLLRFRKRHLLRGQHAQGAPCSFLQKIDRIMRKCISISGFEVAVPLEISRTIPSTFATAPRELKSSSIARAKPYPFSRANPRTLAGAGKDPRGTPGEASLRPLSAST